MGRDASTISLRSPARGPVSPSADRALGPDSRRLLLDQRQGDLLGNVSEHRANDQGDHANNERVLERGRGDRAELVARQGETGDSRVSENACRNVAQRRRLSGIYENENRDEDAYRRP